MHINNEDEITLGSEKWLYCCRHTVKETVFPF